MRADSIVLKTIKDRKLVKAGDILLLGLSGGPDSLCLLDILTKLQPVLSFKLYALHVNHQIRGAEADRDMMATIQQCKDRYIPITVKIANIPKMAAQLGIGEEEAGRKIRHQTLQKIAGQLKEENYGARVRIVLAHNKDDQAETVLMRILRGTGVHGLGAMEYERGDDVIRPLLDVPRSLIEQYCYDNGLNPNIDSSNDSLEYTRNRIRLRLIPALERDFNPNLKDSLARLADSAREDDACLTSIAKNNLPKILVKGKELQTSEWDSMPRKQLEHMDPAVAKRVVRMMFERCGLGQDFSAVHINSLLDAVKNSGAATIEFPKGYTAVITADKVSFRGPGSKYARNYDFREKQKNVEVSCKVVAIEDLPPIKSLGPEYCALDALKLLALEGDLFVRTRMPGDRIRPLGMKGSKKLQDYMTDRKIPREIRDDVYLLCSGSNVLWVKGYTVSDLCKIDEDTDFVLVTKVQED